MSAPSPPLPWASQPAVKHSSTRRAIHRRLIRQAVLLLVVWPGFFLAIALAADTDAQQFIPILVRGVFVTPVLLPHNIWGAVTALRMHRRLSAHPWRTVKCEIVVPGTHRWRLRECDPATGREVRVPAILCIGQDVLTSTPFKRHMSVRLTHVWCAGPPGPGAVVSEPGGARPFRLALRKDLTASLARADVALR
ncbi:hypothetical protein [Streptomyces fuscichromogenes]|uniref:Uncharacterized protein n=1 Tax=Streptomyces fuscichromogenes TaxID=1324013 RepID=A0A917XJM4_9ACTN|nr:hypothetical protein [Streptomyces fuscichromogenes]GGN33329.1 hypothetical protein GCM10011578_073100 [Streptomyces fuscichromogenes]